MEFVLFDLSNHLQFKKREFIPVLFPECILKFCGGKSEMVPNEMLLEVYERIRSQAEERIKQWSHYGLNDHTDLHELIHELKIHLAEQEIMNEELRQTIKRMDDGKEKE